MNTSTCHDAVLEVIVRFVNLQTGALALLGRELVGCVGRARSGVERVEGEMQAIEERSEEGGTESSDTNAGGELYCQCLHERRIEGAHDPVTVETPATMASTSAWRTT